MARAILTDRVDPMPVGPEALWARLGDVGAYPGWWPWLRAFDARALRAGETWRATISPPLPWRLTVAIHLEEVVEAERVVARLTGDIAGPARLELRPDPGGTLLALRAELAPAKPALRALAATARPLAQASHDHVIVRALDQLRRHL